MRAMKLLVPIRRRGGKAAALVLLVAAAAPSCAAQVSAGGEPAPAAAAPAAAGEDPRQSGRVVLFQLAAPAALAGRTLVLAPAGDAAALDSRFLEAAAGPARVDSAADGPAPADSAQARGGALRGATRGITITRADDRPERAYLQRAGARSVRLDAQGAGAVALPAWAAEGGAVLVLDGREHPLRLDPEGAPMVDLVVTPRADSAGGYVVEAQQWASITWTSAGGPLDVFVDGVAQGSTEVMRAVRPGTRRFEWRQGHQWVCAHAAEVRPNMRRRYSCADGRVHEQ
jgi:hypothetical protein